ncbi:MAG: HEAT repeat domain-containing protein [Candidatus Riflebacteria bacterium]|nr:HEAT repeat domain-containing protein [Candidatus Riflebacteria bacterium]
MARLREQLLDESGEPGARQAALDRLIALGERHGARETLEEALARLREGCAGLARRIELLSRVRADLPDALPREPAAGEARRPPPAGAPEAPRLAPGGVLEDLASRLASGEPDRRGKLELIKHVVEHPDDPRAVQVLDTAARAPANASIRHVIVRSLGYLRSPQVWDVLARFVSAADESVASNALKAAASLDPGRAVQLALPVLLGTEPKMVRAAVRVLVDRCRPEADRALLPMARSADPSERLAAIAYLRVLPPGSSHDLVMDLLEIEPDEALFGQLARLVPRFASKAMTGRLDRVSAALSRRQQQTEKLIVARSRPAPEEASRPAVPGQPAGTVPEPARQQVPAQRPAPPPGRPARGDSFEAATGDPGEPATNLRELMRRFAPTSAPGEGQGSTIVMIRAQLTTPVRWALVVLGLVSVVGVALVLRTPPEAAPMAPIRTAPGLAVHQLGRVNDPVTCRGELTSVTPNDRTAVLRIPDGTSVVVVVDDVAQLQELKPGQSAEASGRIQAIRGPQLVVVSGRLAVRAAR